LILCHLRSWHAALDDLRNWLRLGLAARVYEYILHMADALSDGIVKQVPNKFS
jgi:hypothetical protein